MKIAPLAGIILVILGIVSLTYQGISYTTRRQVAQVGPLHATKEEHKTIPLPPVLGGLAIAGGVVLLFAGKQPT